MPAYSSIEEQHPVGVGSGPEHLVEVLLRLPDVLAHHLGQIDLEQVQAQLAGQHLGCEGLAGPGGAEEQRGGTGTARQLRGETPIIQNARAA
jgi:hypothetical protein